MARTAHSRFTNIREKELTKLYAEYQAELGRPVPAGVHRQGRNIPGCV
jgi:hypothetical protein